jgi:hypothetical protein
VKEGTRLLPLFATGSETSFSLDAGDIDQMKTVNAMGGVCGFTPKVFYRSK